MGGGKGVKLTPSRGRQIDSLQKTLPSKSPALLELKAVTRSAFFSAAELVEVSPPIKPGTYDILPMICYVNLLHSDHPSSTKCGGACIYYKKYLFLRVIRMNVGELN